jgi:inorganic triphosphatase YgiF
VTAGPRRASREVELSLVVTDPDPEAVFRRLARLRKLDGYILEPRGSVHIVDRYFDTEDRKLRKQGLALRLRTSDRETSIGLKGPRRSASTRTEDRFEQERAFSAQAVEELGRRLRLRGAPVDVPPDERSSPDALLELELGVQPIQRRETVRRLRDVLDPGAEAASPLAELALDRVHFQLDGQEVRHYEIEVEAKQTGRGTEAARVVAAELEARYRGQLSEWPFGKLATGKAIEEFLTNGRLKGLSANGELARSAYERIRRYLERQP